MARRRRFMQGGRCSANSQGDVWIVSRSVSRSLRGGVSLPGHDEHPPVGPEALVSFDERNKAIGLDLSVSGLRLETPVSIAPPVGCASRGAAHASRESHVARPELKSPGAVNQAG